MSTVGEDVYRSLRNFFLSVVFISFIIGIAIGCLI